MERKCSNSVLELRIVESQLQYYDIFKNLSMIKNRVNLQYRWL